MSKGLEALCYLDDIAHGRKMSLDSHELKLIIEKELKALEIIKRKYNFGAGGCLTCYGLAQEEFDLLKEVLL